MLHRWTVQLTAHKYSVEHPSAKEIPQIDFLSQHAKMKEPPMVEKDCLLVRTLIVARAELALETKTSVCRYSKLSETGLEYRQQAKFNEYYIKGDELSISLCCNDRIIMIYNYIIPRCCGYQSYVTYINHTWASKR